MGKGVEKEKVERRRILDKLTGDERILVAEACDKVNQAVQQQRPQFTAFLDPAQRALIEDHAHLWDAGLTSWGGYAAAERQLLAFVPFAVELDSAAYPIAALEISGNFSFNSVNHRDYLGSLMALGIKREMLGDIIVDSDGGQVILHRYILGFVQANWQSIGRVSISVREIPASKIRPPQQEQAVRTATVASLRLDAVTAAAYRLSRTQACKHIRAGRLKHNYRPETRCDRLVSPGDMLSLAGYGRAQLIDVGGKSKRGRQHIKVGRWL